MVWALTRIKLVGRRAVLEEAGRLLVDRLFDRGRLDAGLDHRFDPEEAGDFARPGVGRDLGGDLVGVDEAVVEPGRFAVGQDRSGQVQEEAVPVAPGRNVPDFVDPGLGTRSWAVCRCSPVRLAMFRPGRASGGPGGMSPKYALTLAIASSGVMSPAMTTTALDGP